MTNALERVLDRVQDLPAIPEVVSEVLALTDDPTTDMDAVSHVIERDPGLAARILRVSNSPYFGLKQHVGTLKLAIVILGTREIRNIVLGVSVFDTLRDPMTDRLLKGHFWDISFRVGAMAKRVGKDLRLGCQGEDFIAGLLHGIGKMVLCRNLSSEYAALLEAADSDGALLEAEARHFGFNHADAGAALARKWNLPESLCDALWLRVPNDGVPLAKARDPRLAAAVRIAYYTAHEPGAMPDFAVSTAIAQSEAWAALEPVTGPLAIETREQTLLAHLQEIEESPSSDFGQ